MTASRTSIMMFAAATAAALAAVSFSGCASVTGRLVTGRPTGELRSSASVEKRDPQLVLAGPARLLHVDVDGSDTVTIFRVVRHDGTRTDCRRHGARVWTDALRDHTTNRLDLDVPQDEVVCLTIDEAGTSMSHKRMARVSWHAQQLPPRQILTAELSSDEMRVP